MDGLDYGLDNVGRTHPFTTLVNPVRFQSATPRVSHPRPGEANSKVRHSQGLVNHRWIKAYEI